MLCFYACPTFDELPAKDDKLLHLPPLGVYLSLCLLIQQGLVLYTEASWKQIIKISSLLASSQFTISIIFLVNCCTAEYRYFIARQCTCGICTGTHLAQAWPPPPPLAWRGCARPSRTAGQTRSRTRSSCSRSPCACLLRTGTPGLKTHIYEAKKRQLKRKISTMSRIFSAVVYITCTVSAVCISP